jgi:Carboxypeptidase regulatory-like domain
VYTALIRDETAGWEEFFPMSLAKYLQLGLLLALAPLKAQIGTATISGSLMDPSGAAISGAAITAVQTETGFRRQTASNELGQYSLPGLTPGTYDLTVESAGFKRAQQRGMVLQVDQNARADVVLEIGQVTEIVEITAQTPLIESQSASLGAVIDTQKILALPLNGRNFVQLALLVPGANTGAPGSGVGGAFSVSGLRSEQNAFQIDGTSNSDGFENNIGVTPSIDALQEFKIQTNNYSAEFGKGAGAQVNLVTKSGTREFHGAAYEFLRHDAVQARRFFDRDRISFPCDRSDPNLATRAACAPPFKQNQFGFVLGGPLAIPGRQSSEGRTFFFTGYEGFRQVRGAANRNNVPTPEQRRGDFSQNLLAATAGTDALGRTWRRGQIFDPLSSRQVADSSGRLRFVREPFPNNVIPASQFDPISARMIADAAFIPLPNDPGSRVADGNMVENFLDGRSRRSNFDQFSARVDHQFSDNDTIFGRFTYNDSNAFDPRSFPGFGSVNNQRNLNTTLSYSKVLSPSTLNELRLGHQGWFQQSAAEDNIEGINWIGKFGIRGLAYAGNDRAITGSPGIAVAGFTGWGNGGGPLRRRNNTFQVIDNFSFNKGRHFMKVGFELRRVRENVIRAQDVRGNYSFGNPQWTGIDGVGNTGHNLANFLLGLAQRKARRVSDFATRLRAAEYGFYFQDDIKATRNLTLNVGLRYQLYIPPKDTRDGISTMIFPGGRCPSYQACSQNFTVNNPYVPTWGIAGKELPRSLSPVDKKNLGPRFGFAWRPWGNTKTVLRGGYGIFYDTPPILLSEDTIENYPNVIEDQHQGSLFQNGLPPAEGKFDFVHAIPGLGPGPVAQFLPGPNVYSAEFRNAYIQSWNFGIQRELPGQMMVEVAYAGTKATRLNRREASDMALPLGPRYPIGDLSNNPNIRSDLAGGRNQFRLLVPFAMQNGIIVPLADIFETTSSAFSNYNGLQMRLEKRYSKGLTLLATYTWSKAMSDATGFNAGGSAGAGNRVQDYFNKTAEKGLADLDHRHRFTAAGVYELPFGKGRHFGGGASRAVDALIGGWGLDGILSLQSGYPITVRRSGDPGSVGTDGALRPDITCKPDIPRGQQTVERFFRTECFAAPEALVPGDVRYGSAGRSTVQGPGAIGVDLSLRKVTSITERVKTEFRAEFFNAINHASWILDGGSRDFGTAQFGRVNNTSDPRIIQFGLKVQF